MYSFSVGSYLFLIIINNFEIDSIDITCLSLTVPDSRLWMGKKTTLASLDDKARKKKLKKIYANQDVNAVLPSIPPRKSRQRKAKSSEGSRMIDNRVSTCASF